MKVKGTLSLLLVLVMLLAMLPVTASAQGAYFANGTDKTTTVQSTAPVGSSIRLNQSRLNLVKGTTYKLKLNVSRTCKWTTSNRYVATVSSKGVVKAVGYGTCTIACRLSNGTRLTCKITVLPRVDVIPVALSGGKFYFRIANRYASRTMKKASFNVTEVSNSGRVLCSYRVDVPVTLKPGYTSDIWEVSLSYPKSCRGIYYMPVSATFRNGAVWRY